MHDRWKRARYHRKGINKRLAKFITMYALLVAVIIIIIILVKYRFIVMEDNRFCPELKKNFVCIIDTSDKSNIVCGDYILYSTEDGDKVGKVEEIVKYRDIKTIYVIESNGGEVTGVRNGDVIGKVVRISMILKDVNKIIEKVRLK